jgi:uncharacterized protein
MLCYRPSSNWAAPGKSMKSVTFLLAALVAAAPVPAIAQASDTDSFINAIRARDGDKALDILGARGVQVLNSRNLAGETALLVAISNRDSRWTRYLLQEGANPNFADRSGDTPLIAAARIGWSDAVDWLLARGAKVDSTNRRGETALIIAVQQRQPEIVRTLLAEGADPDRKDAAAGYSARDYARRDTRSRELLSLIETAKKKPVSQKLEDFKLD